MYEQLHKQGKGNFKNAWYWSSSRNYSGNAWDVGFNCGGIYDSNKSFNKQVRAVRAF